jgi:hypothetical protein
VTLFKASRVLSTVNLAADDQTAPPNTEPAAVAKKLTIGAIAPIFAV